MLRRYWSNKSGSIAVYAAFFSMLALSAGSIAIDLGRLVTLKAQMQHRADAGATAGAVQLDGTTGAMQRAKDVASNASSDKSNIDKDGGLITVATTKFYSAYSPTKVAATNDRDARVIEVNLTPQLMDFYFTPFLSMLIDQVTAHSMSIDASAVAQYAPVICHAPPLMMCDLSETGGEDVMDPVNTGRQLLVKFPQGGNAQWVPGNFGLLESGYGSGANNLERALADVEPPGCDSNIITTEPGTMAQRVKNGINARFNGSGYYTPAPNVQSYPRDTDFDDDTGRQNNDRLGDDDWDIDDYWSANHNGDSLPSDLTGATRYQTYLYEMGETYASNGNLTLYPSPDTLPDGYIEVTPSSADLPTGGEPDTIPASNGALRRVMQVAVLQCIANDVKGRGDYPTDGNYIEVFITEPVGDPPETSIYGEIIGRVIPSDNVSFHSNATLVD